MSYTIYEQLADAHNSWLTWFDRLERSESKEFSLLCRKRIDTYAGLSAHLRSRLINMEMEKHGFVKDEKGIYRHE